MHRQSGRHLKVEYYLEIECLPDDQLFSPSEIVKRKYDKQAQPECFTRMFHAIYQFGLRNGLTLYPDNGKRLPGGKYAKTEKGRVRLKPGERRAKWLGKTWKSKLYVEDRQAIERYAKQRLVETLDMCLTGKRRKQRVLKEKEAKMRKTRLKIRMKKSFWMVALVAAVVLTAGSLYNYNYLHEGYAVLRSEGPKAALEFFQNRGDTYDNLFGQAWAAYRNGSLQEAERLARLVRKSSSMKDMARASYLIGELKTIDGNYDLASEHLQTALALYESTGKSQSVLRTRLALAKLYITQKDLSNAKYYINLAGAFDGAEKNHVFLYLQSQVAFLENDYDQALSLSLAREKIAREDKSQLAGIYSDIGFYYGLTGNLSKCLEYTQKAEGLAAKQENSFLLMYNKINLCLYFKCTMNDYAALMDAIFDYAKENKDTKLMEQIYFVEKFQCPIPQTDPGHLDPPDDPPPDPPGNLANQMPDATQMNRKEN